MSAANIVYPAVFWGSANTQATAAIRGGGAVIADAHIHRYDMAVSEALIPTSPSTEATRAMADITREEIKAQHEAIEARTETKITRLEGKLDLVLQSVGEGRTETRESRRAVIANQWVIFSAIILVIGVFVTVAPFIFDMGFKWRETITKEIGERLPPAVEKK